MSGLSKRRAGKNPPATERTSELRYRALIETTQTGYVMVDGRGRVVDANPEYVRMTGYDRLDAILGRSVVEWTAPYDRERNAAEVRACLANGFVRNLEVDYVALDGRITPLEINATVMRSPSGDSILTICRDITRRRQVEAGLKSSEYQYRATVDSLADAVHVVDQEFRIVLVNEPFRRWCERLGVPPCEPGRLLFDVFPFLSRRVHEEYARVFRTGQPLDTEETTTAGRESITTETRKVPVVEKGRVVRVITIVRDISARKQAEETLRRSQEQFRALTENTPDVVDRFDCECRHLYVNPAGLALLGLPADRVIGRTIRETSLPEPWAGLWEERIGRVFQGGDGGEVEDSFPSPEGLRTFHSRLVPEFAADGAVRSVLVVSRDTTERHRAEEALRQAHDRLEETVRRRTAQLRALTARLTHAEEEERQRIARVLHEDVQQLLAGARYRLGSLRKRASDGEQDPAVDDVLNILNDAMAAARSLSVDLRPPVLYELGVVPALKWLAEDMHRRFGLSVKLELDAEAEPSADDLRIVIFQSARELLFNVVKHAGVKTARMALTRQDGEWLRLEVSDKGAGFDVADAGVDRLGLFGIRERVDPLCGRVELDSAPGRGARVVLLLPAR